MTHHFQKPAPIPAPLSAPARQQAALLIMELKRAERELENLIRQGHHAPIEIRFREALAAANGRAARLARTLDRKSGGAA